MTSEIKRTWVNSEEKSICCSCICDIDKFPTTPNTLTSPPKITHCQVCGEKFKNNADDNYTIGWYRRNGKMNCTKCSDKLNGVQND